MEIIKQSYLQVHQKEKKFVLKFVVLKVIDDQPILEVHSKKVQANSPANFDLFDLRKCNYVGLKIPVGHECFEFVVCLENQVITFAAKTWTLRNEWVQVLKLKLRELKIISPKENIYTKPPEMRPVILQSTRNPRDPLPQRPGAFSSEIPGLEVPQIEENAVELRETLQIENDFDHLAVSDDESTDPITIPVFNFSTSNTTSQNLINLLSNPLRHTANANANFTPFSDSFEAEEEDEGEILENIPPTSLHVDYVPEPQSDTRDNNITVIKIAESEYSSQPKIKKDLKVTKIKIEMEENIVNASEASKVEKDEASTSAGKPSEIKIAEKIKTPPVTPRKLPDTPKRTPVQDKRKLSLREKQVLQLQHEINTEIRFKLRKKDCIDAIAFVTAYNSVWIAGFKPNPVLYCLHVGDQLLAINNIVIKTPQDAQKYIKMCSGLFVEVTVRRLPLANIFLIKREFEGQCLGIIRDGSTPNIVDLIPNSVSSHIPPRPISADENSTWVITQINFRNISIISQKKFDETELLLNSSGMECCLLLQPSDFIVKLKKELKNLKNYRDYSLQ